MERVVWPGDGDATEGKGETWRIVRDGIGKRKVLGAGVRREKVLGAGIRREKGGERDREGKGLKGEDREGLRNPRDGERDGKGLSKGAGIGRRMKEILGAGKEDE